MSHQFKVGDRIVSKQIYSWTVEEFDDFPLIVYPGDVGIVVHIDYDREVIYIEWDKDKFKHISKVISFEISTGLGLVE